MSPSRPAGAGGTAPPAAVVEHLRRQAATCRSLGAGFTAALCDAAADDVARGGPVADVLRTAPGEDLRDPGPSALGLRLVGALHRLVLAGAAPRLAACYPGDRGDPSRAGPDGDPAAAAALLPAVVAASAARLRADLGPAPQTNEVARGAALWGAVLRLVAEGAAAGTTDGADGPVRVRLVDVGSSAGLLLRPDGVRLTADDGGATGPVDAPVRLERAWDVAPWSPALVIPAGRGGAAARGPAAPDPGPAPDVRVVARDGADVAPLDPTDPEHARRLLSFVWPEQRDRAARLEGALAAARAQPVEVRRAGAAEVARGLRLVPGEVVVVQQSVVRQYVPVAERAEAEAALDALGATATPSTPLWRLALEPHRRRSGGTVRYLVEARVHGAPPRSTAGRAGAPGARLRLLGEAAPHGVPVRWWARTPPGWVAADP
jgi:hypothetical protein